MINDPNQTGPSAAPIAVRSDGRGWQVCRPMRIQPGIAPAAAGSALVSLGATQVICAASLEEGVPRWMRDQQVAGGWLTAEYSLLPYATSPRTPREVSVGRVGGRTMEIQRMVGRALRAVVDVRLLGPRTLWVDCDVLCADGGTRTAAVSGAWVAVALALKRAHSEGRLEENPVRDSVAAISVGLLGERLALDLSYAEDATADADLNVVMTGNGRLVEIQGGAEHAPFASERLSEILALARLGIEQWTRLQQQAVGEGGP